MNKPVEEILLQVPELNREFVSDEALGGGLCNQTYKVQTQRGALVLRINSRQNEYLNLTRRSEVEVMKEAHRAGLAPKIIAGDDPERFVVTEYIEGRMLVTNDLQNDGIKEMIMDRLKRIHGMEGQNRTCSPYNLIYGYLGGIYQL